MFIGPLREVGKAVWRRGCLVMLSNPSVLLAAPARAGYKHVDLIPVFRPLLSQLPYSHARGWGGR